MKAPRAGLDDLFARLAEAQDRVTAAAPPLSLRAAPAAPARRVGWKVASAAIATLAAGAAAILAWHGPLSPQGASPQGTSPLTATASGQRPGPISLQTMVAAGDNALPLRFSDGSIATLRPGSTGRLLRLEDRGAEVELMAGRIEAAIVHGQGARWLFRAGPFAVHVTGTRFDVDWSPITRRLVVVLREGGVTVAGAVLGAGLPLRAGQRLAVVLDAEGPGGSVRTEALPGAPETMPGIAQTPVPSPPWPSPASAAAGPPLRPAAPGPRRSHSPDLDHAEDWLTLADRGAQADAWQAARRIGVDDLRRRLAPAQLLALADVARYAGARDDARDIFLTLVTRFPQHRLASDAVFSLGRLAFEAGDAAAATTWFARYQRQWPEGALASEATGRLIEAAVARHDPAFARAAAQSYLDQAPRGPYAALAHQILSQPAAGAPAGPAR